MAEYDTFVGALTDLPQGQETAVFIRELAPGQRKYGFKHVRAIVSSAADKLPDGEPLWMRFKTGVRHAEPWRIKIIKEV